VALVTCSTNFSTNQDIGKYSNNSSKENLSK